MNLRWIMSYRRGPHGNANLTVSLAFASLLAAPTCAFSKDEYGAVAVGMWRNLNSANVWASTGSGSSRSSAGDAALAQCNSNSTNCQVVLTWGSGYCGFVTTGKSQDGSGRVGYGTGQSKQEAYDTCMSAAANMACDANPIGFCLSPPEPKRDPVAEFTEKSAANGRQLFAEGEEHWNAGDYEAAQEAFSDAATDLMLGDEKEMSDLANAWERRSFCAQEGISIAKPDHIGFYDTIEQNLADKADWECESHMPGWTQWVKDAAYEHGGEATAWCSSDTVGSSLDCVREPSQSSSGNYEIALNPECTAGHYMVAVGVFDEDKRCRKQVVDIYASMSRSSAPFQSKYPPVIIDAIGTDEKGDKFDSLQDCYRDRHQYYRYLCPKSKQLD
ncbi:DUF4189 domain-containing protein [Mesorhizobium sp. BAC0120]|uniref:DUF4189 domain-containing protein n=1 Tax=Mesorhizobium sp. BAC0120 TaxID=3090670 RepID=UPI00298BDC21|nr:DUF4189 domain-containing protein [Mesorhizobium sp. BAC0120]MDW6024180.1 DUF4189 domain-containing protein [Mesorhizobium sp. BAC0120]